MKKYSVMLAIVVMLSVILAGCGTVTDAGVIFRTADPNLAILVPFAPPLPTVTPDVHPEATCVVKGNISSSGEKIYHIEGQANYNNVVINPDTGERCFDTEEEAVAAGWRKSQR